MGRSSDVIYYLFLDKTGQLMQQFYRCVLCFVQGLKCNMQAMFMVICLTR